MSESNEDDLFAEEFLAANNHYRRLHGVPELQISQDLQELAEQWAKKLAHRRHMAYFERPGIGDCITMVPVDLSASDICEYWYKESRRYEYETPGWQVGTNYFTQIIWRCTKEVGIGVAPLLPLQKRNPKTGQLTNDPLNDHQVVVALYRPSGNSNRPGEFEMNVNPPLPENSNCHS
ncbi:Golgi-associated plant pathogenesis-related protein 1 [Aphelenchoides besseyi]|nr:Golgi-associated plant pathogenesis-related protein 1 [Aphelenchoides besseyi]